MNGGDSQTGHQDVYNYMSDEIRNTLRTETQKRLKRLVTFPQNKV